MLGALVGGFASAVGSYCVSRAITIRDVRVEICRQLLPRANIPELREDWRSGPWGTLVRAALTAGRRDVRTSRELQALLEEISARKDNLAQREDPDTGAVRLDGPGADEYYAALDSVEDKTREYEEWLARKLG